MKLMEVYERKLTELNISLIEHSLKAILREEGFQSKDGDAFYWFAMKPYNISIEVHFMRQIRCSIKYQVNEREASEPEPRLAGYTTREYEVFIFLYNNPCIQLRTFLDECKEIVQRCTYLDINYWKEAVQEFFDL